MERMFTAKDLFPNEESGVKVIVKVVSPPEVEVVLSQMLVLSEGGFNTVIVGATPLSSVDVNVMVFVLPTETVCVLEGNPLNAGGSFEALAISKKKSIGICDLLSPLLSKSCTITKAVQRSPAEVLRTLSWTSHSIKPEGLNVIPVSYTHLRAHET